MKVPPEIERFAAAGLDSMRRDPYHRFDWRTRREIYREIKAILPEKGHLVHSWMALLAAEAVLPIFMHHNREDNLPARLLNAARSVLLGEADKDSRTVQDLLDEGYHGTGIDALDWRGRVAYNAEYAGEACYKALLEVSGYQNLLDNVEMLRRGIYRDGTTVMSMGGTGAGATGVSGDNFSDEDIAHLAAASDTASAAAIASSCAVEEFLISPAQLASFWEWWAIGALRQAWEKI